MRKLWKKFCEWLEGDHLPGGIGTRKTTAFIVPLIIVAFIMCFLKLR